MRTIISHLLSQATASEDGAKQFQAQIICRAIGDNNTPVSDNDARFIPHVVQVRRTRRGWLDLFHFRSGCIYSLADSGSARSELYEERPGERHGKPRLLLDRRALNIDLRTRWRHQPAHSHAREKFSQSDR